MTKEFEQNKNKTIWSILNIEKTTDVKEIRHAYAVMSKECHPENEPEKFQQLYQAYQEAMKWAKASKGQGNSGFAYTQEEQLTEMFLGNFEQEESELGKEELGNSVSVFDHLEQNDEWIHKKEIKGTETEEVNNQFYKNVFFNITPVAKEGLDSFQSFFESSNPKEWKAYITTPEFLRAQYDETFAKHLAEYLKNQTLYLCEELPYNMIKELYFSYYPLLSEQTEEFFENGFHDLFEVIFENRQIGKIAELHRDASVKSEVIKYQVYYGLLCAIKRNGANQKVNEWKIHISDAARECFKEDGKTSYRDKYLLNLIAFLVEEAPVLPNDIYELMIDEFNLYQLNGSSKTEEQESLYLAILSKCDDIQKLQHVKLDEKAERRQLIEDIKKWYYEPLTDDDRTRLQEYFNSGLFYKHRLDDWLLEYWLKVFALEYKDFPKVFLEEYIAFYDEVYKQTASYVGRELYYMFTEYLAECDVKKTYNEVNEGKKEWILNHFFEESFNRVWSSTSKGAMKTIYKSIVMEHLTVIMEQRNYEWDLWDDGHLKAERSGENYIFSYDKINEQVTISQEEYLQIVEEMLEVYIGRYFMIQSEKNRVYEIVERAKEVIYGNHRN